LKRLIHQRDPLRRRPEQLLPQLANELKFTGTQTADWLENWPERERGPFELLTTKDPRLLMQHGLLKSGDTAIKIT